MNGFFKKHDTHIHTHTGISFSHVKERNLAGMASPENISKISQRMINTVPCALTHIRNLKKSK